MDMYRIKDETTYCTGSLCCKYPEIVIAYENSQLQKFGDATNDSFNCAFPLALLLKIKSCYVLGSCKHCFLIDKNNNTIQF